MCMGLQHRPAARQRRLGDGLSMSEEEREVVHLLREQRRLRGDWGGTGRIPRLGPRYPAPGGQRRRTAAPTFRKSRPEVVGDRGSSWRRSWGTPAATLFDTAALSKPNYMPITSPKPRNPTPGSPKPFFRLRVFFQTVSEMERREIPPSSTSLATWEDTIFGGGK